MFHRHIATFIVQCIEDSEFTVVGLLMEWLLHSEFRFSKALLTIHMHPQIPLLQSLSIVNKLPRWKSYSTYSSVSPSNIMPGVSSVSIAITFILLFLFVVPNFFRLGIHLSMVPADVHVLP